MVVKSLNIGQPKKENFFGRVMTTGFCKTPLEGPVRLTRLGFEGDGVGDRKNHGGHDKAVCVYSVEHYPYWEDVLGIVLPPAPFGENLSVSGLLEDGIGIGDVFSLGAAVVQVSQPRQPCKTLAARYGREGMAKLFADSGRTGFYLRVLEEGEVKQGDILAIREKDPWGVTVAFANSVFYHDRKNRRSLEKVLSVPALSDAWRESFRKLLESRGA